ncbi:hypothetical protein PsAD2_02253 [Pseudovibrio axinellae]|uniref:Uncharacterized protein n=1 Tax=Pseudovibrio axinellae TaxID=989403 RepID=A0A165YDA1_9HYPH|nr:DUF6101 family protein [Pseudovibrio axinellae]KZL18738.1 hypothetical protein PsAD2_02253 [Pseudovibrio axinellae]SEP94631.1 hypothetical protein SAMN05421798_101788 [Pseudovibrio axinellae]
MIDDNSQFSSHASNDNHVNRVNVSLPYRLQAELPDDLLDTPGINISDIRIDPDKVLIRREMCGLPLTLTVPLGSYSGIGAKATVNDRSGDIKYEVFLLHRDHALSIPIYASSSIEQAADHWEAWSGALVLPLLTIDSDGTSKLARLGLNTCSQGEPLPRRKLRALTGRRPHSHAGRDPGRPTRLQKVIASSRRFTRLRRREF